MSAPLLFSFTLYVVERSGGLVIVCIMLVVACIGFSLDLRLVESVGNCLERNLRGPINLDAEEEWAPLFRLEDSRLLSNDMQHCIVAHRLVNEWYVNRGGRLQTIRQAGKPAIS